MTISATIVTDRIGPRADAKAAGRKRYVGGECKHHTGHYERWTSNGVCTKCSLVEATKWRKVNTDKCVASRREWDRANPVKAMLQRARRRAIELDLPFDLTSDDITIPERCPVLGILLKRSSNSSDNSPSLDRIHNGYGYVRGNVVVVSFRVNRLKSNASFYELMKVVEFYAQYYS